MCIRDRGTEATGVTTDYGMYRSDAVVVACDYHHADSELLPDEFKNYTEDYWDKRSMAPSCLLYYLGVNKKVDGLLHHNLFFDAPFEKHAADLYTTPKWPENPLMYVCCPSKTDATVAPEGSENLFVLIPVAPGMQDNESIKEHYYKIIMRRLEKRLGTNIQDAVVYKRCYAHCLLYTSGRLHPAMVKNIWQPGQSANPKGRAMGSRQKLTEKFINDLAANYDRDGMRAIERVAEENPFGYLQIICRLLPKDTHLTISTDLSTSLPPEQLKRIAEAWMISQQEESVLEGESVITTDSETAALPAPDEKPDPVPCLLYTSRCV